MIELEVVLPTSAAYLDSMQRDVSLTSEVSMTNSAVMSEPLTTSAQAGEGLPRVVSQGRRGEKTIFLSSEGVTLRSVSGVSMRAETVRSPSNAIYTSMYTPLITWIPKSLWMQFHRIANIYFFFVGILALSKSVGGGALKPVVVTCVFSLQALKDLYEDLKRRKDDRVENTRTCSLYNRQIRDFSPHPWQECSMGSAVRIERGSQFPADLLVVASSDESGSFYVATKSLDGETNLKQRQVPSALQNLAGHADEDVVARLERMRLQLQLEPCHASLTSMDCSFCIGAQDTSGLCLENFALRGCELQNTAWVIGIACYVGKETKIRKNSSGLPAKRSDLEKYLNMCVVGVLVAIGSVSLLFAVLSLWFPDGVDGLIDSSSHATRFTTTLKRYIVMLWAVLPITLYILFEILHLWFGREVEIDEKMYDSATDSLATARNTAVIEDLGQVSFVFSDKTGTLTANEMRFAFCCIDDVKVGSFLPDSDGRAGPGVEIVHTMLEASTTSKRAKLFFDVLAVCHSVKLDDVGVYQAESPDELALVQAATSVGVSMIARRRNTAGAGEVVVVDSGNGGTQEHVVAYQLPFSSDRKRMSVVIPLPDSEGGGALVWTKGADNIMEALMRTPMPKSANTSIDEFANKGLRTLVLAQSKMSASTYAEWQVKWEDANSSLTDRAESLDKVYAAAELGLEYIGITALEDRLQDEVPAAIEGLRGAGIRVWVLTGDKVETAKEIAKSCKLFPEGMQLVEVVGVESSEAAITALRSTAAGSESGGAARGIVLDGQSVKYILEDEEAQQALFELGMRSSSCVCCRLSPLQKRQLVKLVRHFKKDAITLAIGDGANDVSMIQGAHIGVGIRGKEGGAAVQASDFAISQFRFLENLLFCHGRKAYRRVATFLLYFMYKSCAIGMPYLIHAFSVRFRGHTPFAPLMDALYAPTTSWSVALVLAFDNDISDEHVLATPGRYFSPGLNRKVMNGPKFGKWVLTASVHGFLAWIVPMWAFVGMHGTRTQNVEFWTESFTAFTILQVIVHLKLITIARWKVGLIGGAAIAAELGGYLVIAFTIGAIASQRDAQCLPDERDDPYCIRRGMTLTPVCPPYNPVNRTDGCTGHENIPILALMGGGEAGGGKAFWRLLTSIGLPIAVMIFDYAMIRIGWALRTEERPPQVDRASS